MKKISSRLNLFNFFLCLFILLGLSTEARGEMMDFIFRNMKYKQSINVEAYLITEEEICSLVKSDSLEKINQKSYKEIDKKTVYLFVRLTNQGNRSAWGLLNCKVYKRNLKISIPVMTAHMNKWNCYLISLYKLGWPKNDTIPQITTEWQRLYTK